MVCTLIFESTGGEFDGERLQVDSSYHVCCGTLEINAGLIAVYKRWRNKQDGCERHRRDGGGDQKIRVLIWDRYSQVN